MLPKSLAKGIKIFFQNTLMGFMQYDVIIIGAGPAGLFAANELAGKAKTLVVDLGGYAKKKTEHEKYWGKLKKSQCV